MTNHHDSLEDSQRIDAVCDRFEAAWNAGQRLPLASLLSEVPDQCRERLFEELLGLEIELRGLAGESPSADDYCHQFPHLAHCVAACFAGVSGRGIQSILTCSSRSPVHVGTSPGARVQGKAEDAHADANCVPMRFGRFELLSTLGEGGFGTVWKAYDPLLRRCVALKIPRRGQVCPLDTSSVLQEARAVARLRHAAVVQVYDVGEEGDIVYIASEYIDGESLRQYLARQRMPVRQVAELGVRLSQALHHAHTMGIIHRDLKPSNILLDSVQAAWLTDFGLARQVDQVAGKGRTPSVLGTLAYMPPEQACGNAQEVDCRADIYSLGVVLFELLAGRRPFEGEPDAVRTAIQELDAPVPRKWNPEIPRDLEAICLKCLEKPVDRRYDTADALALDLGRFLRGEAVTARPISAPIRLLRLCRRRPVYATLVLTILLLLGAVGAGSVVYSVRAASLLRSASANRYFHNIIAAQNSWVTNDVDYFRELLEDCPADLRQWEWHYLQGLQDSTKKTLDLAGGWVVYSPDGSRIATAGCEKAVKIWDADSGELLSVLRGHKDFPCAAVFSPDGGRIASAGGDDRMAVVWDLATGRPAGLFRGHQGPVVGVRFTSDGRRLISASLDKTVRIWDVSSHEELQCLRHDGRVWAIDVSADGATIVSASGRDEFSAVRLWSVDTGDRIWELPGLGRQVDVAFSPDGKSVAIADGLAGVRVVDVGSHRQVLSIATGTAQRPHVVFHPDGSKIASNQWDNSIKIWDSASGAELRTVRGQTAPVESLAFRPQSAELAFGTAHDFVFVCDTREEPGALTLEGHQGEVPTIAFSPGGSQLVSGGEDGTVRIWDAERGGAGEILMKTASTVHAVAFSPDGCRLAAAGDEGTVQVWDSRTRQRVLEFRDHGKPVQAMDFSPAGDQIASAGRDRSVKIWDPATGKVLWTLPVDDRDVRSVAFSRCGQWLAVAGRNHQVEIWRLNTQKVEFVYDCEYPACQVKFSPAGQILAIATSDGALRFWEFRRGKSYTRFSRKSDRNRTSISYSPDGARFVTASTRDAVRLWDLEHNRQLLTLEEGGDVAGVVAFSPCGRYIAAVCGSHIRVWRGDAGVK